MIARQGMALTVAQARSFERACGLLREGRQAQALAIAQALQRQAPMAADAFHLLGMCLAESGDAAAAQSAFEAALKRAPANLAILMNYAAWLNRVGRTSRAWEVLLQAADAAPDAAPPRTQLGLLALDANDPVRAGELFSQALRRDPGAVQAWHGLGNALRERGQWEQAADAFARTVALAPGYGPGWFNLGGMQRLRGQGEQALESYRRAREAGLSGVELEDAVNGALLDCGRVADAMAGARRLVARYPAHAAAQATLAQLQWEYGDGGDPLATFAEAVRIRPGDRALQRGLIRMLLEARRSEQALEHARQLHALDRSDPLAQWLLADSHLQLGQTAPADLLYQRVHRQLGGRSHEFLNAYTRHLLHLRRWRQAEQMAAESVRVAPLNQEGWANLGLAWRLLDDPREHWLCDYERLIGVLEIEPPAGHADLASFLQALAAPLEALHQACREPINQSVRRGSQTKGNLFGRHEPEIRAARASLLDSVRRWLGSLPDDPRHPFLARRPSTGNVNVTGAWSVRLWSSGHHGNHVHPQGWISSAFYVGLPPSVLAPATGGGPRPGCIQFGQPLERLGLELAPRRVIQPAPGRLVLFPSYMWHGTVPFVDDAPRLTIAFDLRPDDRR